MADEPEYRMPPATSPEKREHQLVSLAVSLAEQQLREGTASAQVITHYLKLASTREQLEQEKISHENILLQAKTEQIAAAGRIESLYEDAISAMKRYQGDDLPDEEVVIYD